MTDDGGSEDIVAAGDLSSFIRESSGAFRVKFATGSADTSPSAVRKFALFRLGKDLKECRDHPLPMIAAEPLNEETNLWEWHANLMGPQGSSYEDICFHFIMKFPQNYPAAPPKIEICSRFEHPNVFGRWICLDMLQGEWIPDDKTQTTKDIGTGWTPAYSVQSILVQLQAFLFDSVDTTFWSKIAEKWGFTSTTQSARRCAKDFVCNKSGHTGRKPWPEPLAWKDRLRYMVPSKEMPDIAKIKQEFWSFLETIQSLVVQNEWPRICPLECGSFFSWSLLPWYQLGYVSLTVLLNENGSKSMHKKHAKVIRGLINKCYKYLNKRPRPPPNKGVMLALMYRIESALDIAVNNTYSTNNKMRERGYWQWRMKDVDFENILVDEKEENPEKEGQSDEKTEDKLVNEWKDFPLNISTQIEALYCRWQSDLRRPDQLVEILFDSNTKQQKAKKKITQKSTIKNGEKDGKNGKKSKNNKKEKVNNKKEENKQDLENNIFSNGRKYGIITKPKGYHWNVLRRKDLSEDEKKAKYVPYSKEQKEVRVMPIAPLRTKQEKVLWWHRGPHFVMGQTTYTKYKLESSKNNKVKHTPYIYKRTMILDRFQDDYGRWFLNVHPMPTRRDINKNSELVNIEKLKIRSEGTYYKAYVKGDDDKHYVIDVTKGRCRCIEDQKVYKIRRKVKQRSTEALWNEILKETGNEGDIPWKSKPKEKVKLWPWNKYGDKLDPTKYIGRCGFIDLSMDYFEDSDDDSEGIEGLQHSENEDTKGQKKSEEKIVIKQITKCPQLDEKVNGRIMRISRQGMSVDIGYKVNGKPVHAYLDLSQIKCPQHIISKRLEQYLQQKKEEEIEQEEYEQYLKREMKKKKKKRKKKAQQNKKENAKTGGQTKGASTQNEEENETKRQPPVKRTGKFSLPRSCFTMSSLDIKSGDLLKDLYVYDVDSAVNEISLSTFRPLSLLSTGDRMTGIVRSVLTYAAFVDVGAETDAFLHRTALEDAYQDRIIFDCTNNLEVGDKLDLVVTNSDAENNKLEVSIYTDMEASKKEPNRLVLPDDFDESRAVYHSIFGLLCDDIADLVFQFVDRGDLHRLRKVCMLFERIVDNKSNLRFEIEELKCFHSKQNFRNCILGFGVKVVRYPKSAMICDIYPFLDLLSAKSYNAYTVRMSVWKQPFSHWLPVYINKEHGSRSLLWAKRMITEIVNDPKYAKEYKDWNPYYVLKIIPTLMNTMIVKIMKGDLHESIVALEGYTMFYHLLLAFIGEYPFLQQFIDRNLGEFNQKNANNVYRDKKHVKSLGEWIALLATSNKYCWKDVATSYLRECFDRNAKWILTANKALLSEQIPKRQRLTKSFNACQVSLKLCMFHVVFLRMFRYSERSGSFLPVEDVKEKLDKLYGRPTYKMREVLQRNVKRIKKIRSWKQFFDGIYIKCPSDDELYDWLIESMRNSEEKKYHKRYWFMKKRKRADPDAGLFDKFDDAGDAWSAKQFGSDVQSAMGSKKKKMSTADQMMAAF